MMAYSQEELLFKISTKLTKITELLKDISFYLLAISILLAAILGATLGK